MLKSFFEVLYTSHRNYTHPDYTPHIQLHLESRSFTNLQDALEFISTLPASASPNLHRISMFRTLRINIPERFLQS